MNNKELCIKPKQALCAEQMNLLRDAGCDISEASFVWVGEELKYNTGLINKEDIVSYAFSLTDIINLLPDGIRDNNGKYYYMSIDKDSIAFEHTYTYIKDTTPYISFLYAHQELTNDTESGELIDAAFNMLLWWYYNLVNYN